MLELNESYNTRKGGTVTIIEFDADDSELPWFGDNNYWYNGVGAAYGYNGQDIISPKKVTLKESTEQVIIEKFDERITTLEKFVTEERAIKAETAKAQLNAVEAINAFIENLFELKRNT